MTAELSAVLFDEEAAVPVSWIADDESSRWHRPGLLSAWVDDAGRWDLEQRLGLPMDGDLLNWWAATAEHEAEGAALYSLSGQARRMLDPHLISLLRIRLWPLLDLGRDRSSRLADWVARHVLVVPVPLVDADLTALNLVVQPPCPALFRPVGDPTAVQQRGLDVRQERRDQAAASLKVLRAKIDAARAVAAARRAARSRTGDRGPDMLPGLVSVPTAANTGE